MPRIHLTWPRTLGKGAAAKRYVAGDVVDVDADTARKLIYGGLARKEPDSPPVASPAPNDPPVAQPAPPVKPPKPAGSTKGDTPGKEA